jgi:hypothetical protein
MTNNNNNNNNESFATVTKLQILYVAHLSSIQYCIV